MLRASANIVTCQHRQQWPAGRSGFDDEGKNRAWPGRVLEKRTQSTKQKVERVQFVHFL